MSQAVYVNFYNGSDDSTCGSKTQPCKHIETAVEMLTGEIVIIGAIPLNRTINVTRSLTIRSERSSDNASVKGERMTNLPAFSLQHDSELVMNITGINFTDVGVVSIGSHSNVSIYNCYVTGDVGGEKGEVFLFRSERLQGSSLTVVNTTFTGINGSVINDEGQYAHERRVVVTFTDSIFHNIKYFKKLQLHTKVNTSTMSFHRCW